MSRLVIGLIGVRGAGKELACDLIKDIIPEAVSCALADKTKDICSELFGIPRALFDQEGAEDHELGRLVYINRGDLAAIPKAYGIATVPEAFNRQHVGRVLTTPKQILHYVNDVILRTLKATIHCEQLLHAQTADTLIITDLLYTTDFDYFDQAPDIRFRSVYIQSTQAEHAVAAHRQIEGTHVAELGKRALITIHNNSTVEAFEQTINCFVRGL